LIEGAVLTTTVTDPVAEQPDELVPVTEYVVVTVGLTEMLADVAPLLHKYAEPPLAVKVAEAPEQIADADALTLIEGAALTTTVTDPIAEQPDELVPVTEYVVVNVGLTEMLADVAPLLHRYVEPPLAVNVADAPAQIVEADALTLIEGAALTTTVIDPVAEQPDELVPVTEYVVVAAGITEMLADVAPLLHRYVEPPLAVNVADVPTQIVEADALTLIDGTAFTTIVFETTTLHPLELVPVTE
jgi:hypothetical protein